LQRSRQTKYAKSVPTGALRQGEILSNVVQISLYPESLESGSLKFKRAIHDYAIVVTPDCDLDWDFKAQHGNASQGKIISNILLCTAMFSSDLAKRINDDQVPSKKFETKTPWKRTTQNKEERYQFLERVGSSVDLQGEGIRALGIDFKDCFTTPTDILYSSINEGLTLKRCRLVRPYNDHVNSRFAYFQSRIGLPDEHQYIRGEIFLGGENIVSLTE